MHHMAQNKFIKTFVIHITKKSLRSVFRFFGYLLLIGVGLSACDSDKIYENNVAIPTDGWRRVERARFEVEIADTIHPCNIYINVRNNIHYKYADFWLFVDVHAPTGAVSSDTVRIILADHRGKWLGHGLGSKFDSRMVFRKNILFPVSGTYIFEYEQASRDEPLSGIEDIGLRIEKYTIK